MSLCIGVERVATCHGTGSATQCFVYFSFFFDYCMFSVFPVLFLKESCVFIIVFRFTSTVP